MTRIVLEQIEACALFFCIALSLSFFIYRSVCVCLGRFRHLSSIGTIVLDVAAKASTKTKPTKEKSSRKQHTAELSTDSLCLCQLLSDEPLGGCVSACFVNNCGYYTTRMRDYTMVLIVVILDLSRAYEHT